MKPTDFITETSQIAQEADSMHQDHEVQMARSDCYNAAKYAIALHRMLKEISEQQGLDGWVSEKITLANDYLRTVHEYLMHEMAHGQEQEMMGFTAEAAEYAFGKMLAEASKDEFAKARNDKRDAELNRWAAGKGKGSGAKDVADQSRSSKKDAKDRMWAAGKGVKEDTRLEKANSSAVIGEMATGGGSSSGGIATSMGGPGHKPTSGVPKKIGNAHKSKKIAVGKGVY